MLHINEAYMYKSLFVYLHASCVRLYWSLLYRSLLRIHAPLSYLYMLHTDEVDLCDT